MMLFRTDRTINFRWVLDGDRTVKQDSKQARQSYLFASSGRSMSHADEFDEDST